MKPSVVAARFALGALLSVACESIALRGGPTALLLMATGFVVGGLVAGSALPFGHRGAIGFGFAFLIADFPATLSIVATQAMTGRESAIGLLAYYGISWSLVFAIAGFVGLLGAGADSRIRQAGILGFGGGGAVTGVLFAGLLAGGHVGGSHFAVLVDFGTALTLPWIIGAVVVARALNRRPAPETGN